MFVKQYTYLLSIIYYYVTNQLKTIKKGFSEEKTAGFHLAEDVSGLHEGHHHLLY